jgi:hypothetical protein
MYAAATNNFNTWSSTARSALEFIGTTAFAGLVLVLLM